jgi:hypothetical protein
MTKIVNKLQEKAEHLTNFNPQGDSLVRTESKHVPKMDVIPEDGLQVD